MTSSTVKSLFGLWFYLENQAKRGDLLMIDEPELNIHPENQRQIARLLAKLVNAGMNIVISTHSDYIVREFNTLIMLSQDDGTLRKKHKYQAEEVLDPDKVAAYLFDEQEIKPFEITSQDGIYATTFDQVITDLNKVNDDIYYSLQEKRYERNRD
ncbi:MAG: AAA family ATPase [Gammaproteobacteria bacterium]|nr:AAA family ATPase [Gammaproteobacteria bacterium]